MTQFIVLKMIKTIIMSDIKKDINLVRSSIEDAPSLPGVYKMLAFDKQIIYIGKAKNLNKRLTSYLKPDINTKTLRMLELAYSLEYTITSSEVEALLLEAQLIKKFQPKFNILLKDDKSFPYIKLRLDHDYPQLIKYRGRNLIGGKFFGPFASSEHVTSTLVELQKIFKLRSCSDNYFANRKRPCLEYQIGRCVAPCVSKISKEKYNELVSQIDDFLSGKTKELQYNLSQKMQELSANLNFEEAAEIRDRIKALSYIQLKSGLSLNNIKNADVIAIAVYNNSYCIQVFMYRNGQSCGNLAYFPSDTEDVTKEEMLTYFISQFYQSKKPPEEIIVNSQIIDHEIVAEAIGSLSNNKIIITFPHHGNKAQLIENAYNNGVLALEQHLKNSIKSHLILQEVKEIFNLVDIPSRIEIYDNSHIMGAFAVGSMVVATEEGFDKKEYRLYNVNIELKNNISLPKLPSEENEDRAQAAMYSNVVTDSSVDSEIEFKKRSRGDDYGMLREVLTRRFTKLKKEPNKTPSLMIIDGGKGHLSVVLEVMNKFNVSIPFVCMSKGPDRNSGREQFHMIGKTTFTLDKNQNIMKYLQILRDEAHNFAIRGHRKKRSNAIRVSSLDDIKFIGKIRKKALLHYFGSYKAICEASISDLSQVTNISKSCAKNIFNALHNCS